MAQRLHERFSPGEQVEIYFSQIDRWLPGEIAGFAPPGVWVRTRDGRPWFVTNGRRIRPLADEDPNEGVRGDE